MPLIQPNVKFTTKGFERVKKRLEAIGRAVPNHKVSVGIHAEDGEAAKRDYNGKPTETDLITVAIANEFGLGNLPERAWLRSWVDANKASIRAGMAQAAIKEIKKKDATILNSQAKIWAAQLRDWVRLDQGGLEELSAATIEKKSIAGLEEPGTPLFATGQLMRAIKAKIDGDATE